MLKILSLPKAIQFESAYKKLNEQYDLKRITAGLTITGGASLLTNSETLAEEIFNMSTKIGYPHLELLAGATEKLQSPKYATAVGILYQAFSEIENKNFKIKNFSESDPITTFFKKLIANFKDYI